MLTGWTVYWRAGSVRTWSSWGSVVSVRTASVKYQRTVAPVGSLRPSDPAPVAPRRTVRTKESVSGLKENVVTKYLGRNTK